MNTNYISIILAIVLFLALPAFTLAAPGDVDPTFTAGVGTSVNVDVRAVAVQPDGKVIIGGLFTQVNGVARGRVARLNADGTLDTTFDTSIVGFDISVRAVAIQSDGKVIIGGHTTVNGVTRNGIARLNADGTLDTTFDTSVGANSTVNAVAVQSDGKVIIGGSFTRVNNVSSLGIARLLGAFRDMDNDGIGDDSDNCPSNPNSDQADADNDGQGDACDVDDDNDGQTDADEIACGSNPLDATSQAPDSDNDNSPDCVDPDDDNDGVPDTADNCPLTSNPDQADFDLDGIGDTCDSQTGPPRNKEQCKDNGWMRFDTPRTFRNQGDCIQFVNTGR